MHTRSIAILFGALHLAACESAGDFSWQKPIELWPEAQSAFDAYRELPSPGYFAVSEDGRHYGFTYCPAPSASACIERGARFMAIRNCEYSSGGAECRMYAVGGRRTYRGQ